jgi:CheY-like chemotaxis protein
MSILGRGSTVLLLDDNEVDRLLFETCFKRAGYENQMILFDTHTALFDYLSKAEIAPEVLLLDINMPDLDGFEVLQQVRALPSFSKLPIVFFLTNSSALEDMKKAKALGCFGFYTKPIEFDGYVKIFENIQEILKSMRKFEHK